MTETSVTLSLFIQSMVETFYMIGFLLLIGSIIGIPLGILLVVTRPGGIIEHKLFYKIMNPIVNVLRSLPFIILLVAIIPFTRLIVYTSIVTAAAIVLLIVYVSLYLPRLFVNLLLSVHE